MRYIENNIQSWHAGVRRFTFEVNPMTSKKVLFFGDENWLDYFSNICYTIDYKDIELKDYLDEIDLAVFVPSIDLRLDTFSQLWSIDLEKAMGIIDTLKEHSIHTLGISLNGNCDVVYNELFDSLNETVYVSGSDKNNDFSQRGLFCSFTYNPYLDEFATNKLLDFPGIQIITQNSFTFKNSIHMKEISKILKKDLIIFDYDFSSRVYRLDEAIHQSNFLGKVNNVSYQSLLKMSKIQLFFDEGIISDDLLNRQIIENNASYSISLILSKRQEYFEEIGAIVCNTIYEMLDYISFFNESDELRENIAQKGWRLVHSKYSIFNLINRLDKNKLPKASMITPTIRPKNIHKILQNYDNQTYENKELIIVINGNVEKNDTEFLYTEISNRKDISVVQLSNDVLAAGALNVGIIKATGEMVFRIDDDDIYGKNYIKDVMLHHFSSNADFLGKKMEYIYLTQEKTMYRRRINNKRQTFMLDIFSDIFHNIAGNSFALRRSFALQHSFRCGTAGYADSDFLISLGQLNKKPLSLYTDSRNLVVIRNDPSEHTWQAEDEFFKQNVLKKFPSCEWVVEDLDGRLL